MTKKRLSVLAATCVTASAAPVMAELTFSNDTGASMEIYGQVSPVVLSVDDGVRTKTRGADNGNSSTRVGFYLNQEIGEDMRVRFRFETNLGFRRTSVLTNNPVNAESGFDWDREELRHIDLQLRTARYGDFFIGQGSMSGDGIATIDFSGTSVAAYSSIQDSLGSFEFTKAASGALTGIDVNTVFNNFDASRRVRARYDTPSFHGVKFSISAGENLLSLNDTRDDTHYGAALSYETDFGTGTKLKAGIAYERRDRDNKGNRADTERDDLYGSASVLFTNGLNVTLATGQRETKTKAFGTMPASSSPTGTYVYAKIGYIAELFSFGTTAFSVDYYTGEDRATSGDEAEAWGIALVQQFPYRVEAYLGYRNLDYADKTDVAYNDMEAWLFGGRWRF